MDPDDYPTDGPADERCDGCFRYVDACNLNPCIPADLDEEYDR